jgi:hypothetical protein
LSRNGTRTSRPHADVALLARRQSYWCRAFTCGSGAEEDRDGIRTAPNPNETDTRVHAEVGGGGGGGG